MVEINDDGQKPSLRVQGPEKKPWGSSVDDQRDAEDICKSEEEGEKRPSVTSLILRRIRLLSRNPVRPNFAQIALFKDLNEIWAPYTVATSDILLYVFLFSKTSGVSWKTRSVSNALHQETCFTTKKRVKSLYWCCVRSNSAGAVLAWSVLFG